MYPFIRRKKRKRRKPRLRAPELTVAQILAWADDWYAVSGSWPKQTSGRIPGSLGEKWLNVNMALRRGCRGLPGGSSLARLLEEERGVRNVAALPPLRIRQVLAWSDAHHQRTGHWPKLGDGPIPEAPGETWLAVDQALRVGIRGLLGGSSLPQLLAERRCVRNKQRLPPFVVEQILFWANSHHRRSGRWPSQYSGPIIEAPGETWLAVNEALYFGLRGLPGGSSLAQLLAERRLKRHRNRLPRHSPILIIAWARSHRQRTGKWPSRKSGPVVDAPAETWSAIDAALHFGVRGLPGGSSLAQLLADRCSKRHLGRLPSFQPSQIITWARAHHLRTGKWPKQTSGPIADAPGETWNAVETALRNGKRGLPGGSSLARLLADRCGVRNIHGLPPLEPAQILAWAQAHRRLAGQWPKLISGPIPEAPGETWQTVDSALRKGFRGLPGGSSLYRFLQTHYPTANSHRASNKAK